MHTPKQEVIPDHSAYLPGMHVVHAVEPFTLVNEPSGHTTHEDMAEVEANKPGEQRVQVAAEVAAKAVVYVPEKQVKQTVCAELLANVPTLQF